MLLSQLSTDMSKAFDSLLHTLTLKKFEAYGFGSSSLKLMRSFFENSKNKVKIRKVSGNIGKEDVHRPGSSFGPVIWNLFYNDMVQQVTKSKLTMYVDDRQMYKVGQIWQ